MLGSSRVRSQTYHGERDSTVKSVLHAYVQVHIANVTAVTKARQFLIELVHAILR